MLLPPWIRISSPLPALTLAGVILLTSAPAGADEMSPYMMADMHSSTPSATGELMFGFIDDATLIGLEGSLRWPVGRWSFGGRLPLMYSRGEVNDGAALGNVTIDGTYLISARRRQGSRRSVGLNLSLSLPTATDNAADSRAAAVEFSQFFVVEPGLYRPDATTIRVNGEFRTQGRRHFAQAELGLHQLIINDFDDLTLLRLGLAAGFLLSSRVALIGEFTTVSDVIDDSDDENFWHTLDIGLRILTQSGNLALEVYLPVDDSMRGRGAWGVLLAYQARL